MSLVVQKYGGSSLADAESIKRVAHRIVETKKAGHDVCVVVSAMGDTTDELLDLAEQVSPIPPPREMDMLLTAGERISMALVAMAIANLGTTVRSFTGSQAGVITDTEHGKAKIIDVTPGRVQAAIDEGSIVLVAGFQGVSQDSKDITTLGRGGSDTTAVALAAGAAATAITLQFSGRIADTLGRRRPILVGLGLSAVGMGAMGLAGGLVGILVLTTVLAAGAGLLNPAQQATVADVVGNGRSGGKVLAAFQMCQDAGGIGGPVVIGAVADLWGWQWAFALSGLVSALAIIPWSRARETLAAPAG